VKSGEYYTLKEHSTAKIKVKGSKFIGNAFSVNSEDEAKANISLIVKQYYDASHNPYAFKLGSGDNIYKRTGDDGEPAGTAGKPILDAIEKFNLTNTLVIVSRYFGGIKLGKGGLSRAFRECAGLTLQASSIKKEILTKKIKIIFAPELTGAVSKVIAENEAKILQTDYKESSIFVISVQENNLLGLTNSLTDETGGKYKIEDIR